MISRIIHEMNTLIRLKSPVNENGPDTGSRTGIPDYDMICCGPVPVINLV